MKYALIIIVKPEMTALSLQEKQWRETIANNVSAMIKKSENTRLLGESVVECCVNIDMQPLNSFLNQLDMDRIAYRITFLDSPLEWIECPKTSTDQ